MQGHIEINPNISQNDIYCFKVLDDEDFNWWGHL